MTYHFIASFAGISRQVIQLWCSVVSQFSIGREFHSPSGSRSDVFPLPLPQREYASLLDQISLPIFVLPIIASITLKLSGASACVSLWPVKAANEATKSI